MSLTPDQRRVLGALPSTMIPSASAGIYVHRGTGQAGWSVAVQNPLLTPVVLDLLILGYLNATANRLPDFHLLTISEAGRAALAEA